MLPKHKRALRLELLKDYLNVIPLHLHLKERAGSIAARVINAVDKANWDGLGSRGLAGHLFMWLEYLRPYRPVALASRYNFAPPTVNMIDTHPQCDSAIASRGLTLSFW